MRCAFIRYAYEQSLKVTKVFRLFRVSLSYTGVNVCLPFFFLLSLTLIYNVLISTGGGGTTNTDPGNNGGLPKTLTWIWRRAQRHHRQRQRQR